jgi:hypothetical protein
MQERTRFRLAMLQNGYWPLLNSCKRPVDKGWQQKKPDAAEVLAWDRSTFLTTGMKLDGDLAAIDADIREKALRDALIDALDARYPELFVHGLVRHAGAIKQAWFVRVAEPFKTLRSHKWTRGDPADPDAEAHCVECFSAHTTRQFGVDGPHTRENGKIVRVYQFVDDASPATMPRTALPILPKTAFAAACNLFDEIAQAAELSVVKNSGNSGGGGAGERVVYDLTDDMLFASDRASYRGLEELTAACIAAAHEGYPLRVSSSFLGHGANASKCIVGYARGGRYVFIHDFETELTHKPANRTPPDMAKFFALLHRRTK